MQIKVVVIQKMFFDPTLLAMSDFEWIVLLSLVFSINRFIKPSKRINYISWRNKWSLALLKQLSLTERLKVQTFFLYSELKLLTWRAGLRGKDRDIIKSSLGHLETLYTNFWTDSYCFPPKSSVNYGVSITAGQEELQCVCVNVWVL